MFCNYHDVCVARTRLFFGKRIMSQCLNITESPSHNNSAIEAASYCQERFCDFQYALVGTLFVKLNILEDFADK